MGEGEVTTSKAVKTAPTASSKNKIVSRPMKRSESARVLYNIHRLLNIAISLQKVNHFVKVCSSMIMRKIINIRILQNTVLKTIENSMLSTISYYRRLKSTLVLNQFTKFSESIISRL